MNCILCEKEAKIKRDTHKHVMKCPVVLKEVTYQENNQYKDLKSDILTEQINLVKQSRIIYKTREMLMNN